MSTRVLRKLQMHAKKNQPNPVIEDDSETEELSNNKDTPDNLNRYNLLCGSSPSESECKEDDNETENPSAAVELVVDKSKKKKKRKKKKKASRDTPNQISSEDNDIKHKSKITEISHYECSASNKSIDRTILTVELKHLNPQNEMRRKFGKRVTKPSQKRGRRKTVGKAIHLASGKENWPPLPKSLSSMLSMNPCAAPDNYIINDKFTWFTFVHNRAYQNIQSSFLNAMQRSDPDLVLNIIKECPCHVESFYQLSEFCKGAENYRLAGDLIERAIYVMEISLHSSFSLTSGYSRMDYRRQENRIFFIILFKHAQILESRACSRTAFEISKFILNLDPEDPLAIILVLDYYAIRSNQYQWFIDFYEQTVDVKNLDQLPNMAYSYALALFYVHGGCKKANDALQYALLMFPGVLWPLLNELSVQTDKRVAEHRYFKTGVSGSQSPSLNQLVALYVCRAKAIWCDTNVLSWLEENVNVCLDHIEKNKHIIAEYVSKRLLRYVNNPPRNILRHIFVADLKERVPLVEFLAIEKGPFLLCDPLPPHDSINSYKTVIRGTDGNSSSSDQTLNGSVAAFFRSMLPTFVSNQPIPNSQNARNVADIDRELLALHANVDELNTPSGQSYQELRQSLSSIVDALREFLSSIRVTENSTNPDDQDNYNSGDSSDYFDF